MPHTLPLFIVPLKIYWPMHSKFYAPIALRYDTLGPRNFSLSSFGWKISSFFTSNEQTTIRILNGYAFAYVKSFKEFFHVSWLIDANSISQILYLQVETKLCFSRSFISNSFFKQFATCGIFLGVPTMFKSSIYITIIVNLEFAFFMKTYEHIYVHSYNLLLINIY